MFKKVPSHIPLSPHTDGPQKLSELLDMDVTQVDREDLDKKYAIKYNPNPAKRGRFWELVEFSEEDPIGTQVRPRDAEPGDMPIGTPDVEERWVINNPGDLGGDYGEVNIGDHIYWNGIDFEIIKLEAYVGGVSISNELLINVNEDEVVGKQYQSFANAFDYLASLAGTPDEPSQYNRWAIRFNGVFNDTIDVPEFVHLVGDGRNTSGIIGGVNFLGDGGSVVSSISAYNCLLNIDQKNNGGGGGGGVLPVNININEILAYKPSEFNLHFATPPTSGSYGIDFFGTTINFPFNATAFDIGNSIRGLLMKYANITVSGDYTTGFSINLYGLPWNTDSGISVFDISLDVFEVKSWFAVGQSQLQQFAFSAKPTDGSFKARYSYGGNNYEQTISATDLIYNPTMTTLFEGFSDIVQVDFPDYHISPRLYNYQTPTTFNVEFSGFGGVSDLFSIAENTLTSTGGTTPVTANVGRLQEYFPDSCKIFFISTPTSGTYQVELNGLLSEPLNFNATAIDVQNAIRNMDARFSSIDVYGDYTTSFKVVLNKLPVGGNNLDIINIDLDPRAGTKVDLGGGKIDIQGVYLDNPPTSGSFKLRFKRSDLGYTRDSDPIDWSIDSGSFSTQMLLFAQAIEADIGGYIGSWFGHRPDATTFQIRFVGYGGWVETLEVVDNTLEHLTPGPVGQGADISLYNCAVFDAKTETASTLRMFDTDIYQGDFSGFDIVTIKGGKVHSNIGIIFLTPINNVRIDDCDLQSHGEIHINNGELLNCRLAGEKLLIYGKNSIKQCILDIKEIKLGKKDNLNLIQTDGNGIEIVVDPGAKLNIYGTSQINIINQGGDVNTYGDYYDNTISGLSATDEKTAIDELSVMMNNLINMVTPMTGDGSPIDNGVGPRYIGDRYIDNLGPTIYTAYNTTSNDRIS